MIKSDYHIHSLYCDGKNTLKEMAESAIKKGFDALGFSGHSYTHFDESYCMSKRDTQKYIEEVTQLKNEYKDKLNIYLGIELDRYSDENKLGRFDYIIGSVHYVLKDGIYLSVDEGKEIFLSNIEKYYNGDVFAFCEDYFQTVAEISNIKEVSIIGHFDLVTKFNECNNIFNTTDKRYVTALNSALHKIIENNKILEINTGAISRGYRTTPYPDSSILKTWNNLGGKIIFSGDAHSADGIGYKFGEALEISKHCGFNSSVVFDGEKFIEISF